MNPYEAPKTNPPRKKPWPWFEIVCAIIAAAALALQLFG